MNRDRHIITGIIQTKNERKTQSAFNLLRRILNSRVERLMLADSTRTRRTPKRNTSKRDWFESDLVFQDYVFV